MDVAIRRAIPGDDAALALVAQATFLETYAHMIPLADMLAFCRREHGEARYVAWLADPACGTWLAQAAATGAPVGYALVSPPDLPIATEAGDLELKRIYTLHRTHGSGLGARLMGAAIAGAAAAGGRRLLLGVHSGNARALAFYARQGFVQAGVRKFPVGGQVYDDLVLARSLT